MIDKKEQLRRLYEDAIYHSLICKGYTEFQAKVKVKKIMNEF